jgi:hypothetical protein
MITDVRALLVEEALNRRAGGYRVVDVVERA